MQFFIITYIIIYTIIKYIYNELLILILNTSTSLHVYRQMFSDSLARYN